MTVGPRMKTPWSVVGAGFNDDGVYFTFDDTTINGNDIKLMQASPDLLVALQDLLHADCHSVRNSTVHNQAMNKAIAAISKATGE